MAQKAMSKDGSIYLKAEYPRVMQLMIARGMTQETLAKHLGICYSSLYNKLRGRTSFTLEECLWLKEIFNTSLPIERLMEKRSGHGNPWPRKRSKDGET